MIGQGLVLTQKQTLKLNTQLLQSLQLMTLPVAQLNERIEAELLENPTLQAVERDGGTVSWEDYTARQLRSESRRDNYSDTSASYSDEAADSYQGWFEGTLTQDETLQDHLMWQLGCTGCEENVADCARAIISSLDGNGFFSRPLEEVLNAGQLAVKDRALELLHGFDPAGIACEDYRQSLVLQARAAGLEGSELEIFTRLVYDELDRIKSGKDEAAAKDLGIEKDELEDYLVFLRSLSPYPASAWGKAEEHYIAPDVSIRVEDGRLTVRLCTSSIPVLSLDEDYRQMADSLSKSGRKEDREGAKYLKERLQSAKELITQIDMRNTTLEKVAKVLAVKQKAFFLFGQGNLKPLTLRDVAQEIGVHEATVSRITSNKYVDTDWGVIPMKSLFTSAVKTTDGDGTLSKDTVKEMVRKIILENDSGKPLSDQKISDILAQKGISCARRTVNKYRKELDIDSSFERRS